MGTELNLVAILLNNQAQEAKQPNSISKPFSLSLTQSSLLVWLTREKRRGWYWGQSEKIQE